MSGEVVRDFPLFPLGIVALPHEIVPLHIFEERYRTMIGECLERGSEFGIVWVGDDGRRPIGCAVEIAEVLERMEDGRMNILTRGTRPFRIVDEQDDLPYPAGTVEFLLDKDEPADSGTADSAHEADSELVSTLGTGIGLWAMQWGVGLAGAAVLLFGLLRLAGRR